MLDYILRRIGLMLLTLFGVSVAIFLLLRIVPGNIADILFDSAGMVDPAEKQKIIADLGLNQPLVTQYLHWIGGLFRGDLGYSYVSEKPVLDEILPRIPITARLAGAALLFAICTGIPVGVISAVRQNSRRGRFDIAIQRLWSQDRPRHIDNGRTANRAVVTLTEPPPAITGIRSILRNRQHTSTKSCGFLPRGNLWTG